MKALIISLESFQRGEIPEEVKQYIMSTHGKLFTILDESSKIKTNERSFNVIIFIRKYEECTAQLGIDCQS